MNDFVHVVCENYVPTSFGIVGEHGFAAIVNVGGRKVLFDTGQGAGLLGNSRFMGIDFSETEFLALSHGHKDHTGGVMDFLNAVGGKPVVAHPKVFESRTAVRKIGDREIRLPIGMSWTKEDLEAAGAEFSLSAEPFEIVPGLWFSGEVPMKNDFETTDASLYVGSNDDLKLDPFDDDASLFAVTDRGITIIAGCAHRGIVNTMAHARELFSDKPFYAVIGGFHLMDASRERIDKTIEAFREYDVKLIAAGHCTGLPSVFELAKALGDAFRFLWVGKKFDI